MIGRLRRLPAADWVAIAYAATYFVFLAARAAGARVGVVLDLAFYPLGLVVAWANWRNSRVAWLDARTQLAWWLLAVAALILWLTGGIWTFWITVFGPSPYANWIDRCAFFHYVVAIAAYLCFPVRPLPRHGRQRFALDVAFLVVAGFVVAFFFGLRMLQHDVSRPMVVNVLESSFDWALFVIAAVGCSRKRDAVARKVLVLLLGSNILSMTGNFVLAVLPAYTNGHPVDGLWFGAWVLRWWAARLAWRRYSIGDPVSPATPTAEPDYRSNPFSYVLVGLAFLALVVEIAANGHEYVSTLAIVAMGMGVLLVLRQYAEVEENRRLLRNQVARESRFTSLVSNSSDVVLVIDGEGTVSYVSPSLTRVFGADARVEPGTRLQDLLTPDGARTLAAVLTHGPSGYPRFESRVQVAPGRWREVEAVWTDLRSDPAVNGIVVNCRDVTDRNEVERHLRHAQKLDAMGHMAGGLAHDLNNVLSVIRGYSELLQSEIGESSPEGADLGHIMTAVDRASSVTQKVLAFSRKQPGRRVVLDLNTVIQDLRPMLGHLVKDHVEVRLTLAPGLWPVRADQGQLEQVLINLATNARDAMPDGGILEIASSNRTVVADTADPRQLPSGNYVSITVLDEGAGMSPEVLSHIFEPFFSTKPKDRGLGLGLAIVHGIVTDLDGQVDVNSVEGRGTVVTILLPRAPSVVATSSQPA